VILLDEIQKCLGSSSTLTLSTITPWARIFSANCSRLGFPPRKAGTTLPRNSAQRPVRESLSNAANLSQEWHGEVRRTVADGQGACLTLAQGEVSGSPRITIRIAVLTALVLLMSESSIIINVCPSSCEIKQEPELEVRS